MTEYIEDINNVSGFIKVKWFIKRLLRPIFLIFYIPWLRWETFVYNVRCRKKADVARQARKKNLYFTKASAEHKHLVAKVIEKFGHEDFDYIIIVWDGSRFEEDIFKRCRVIYEGGLNFKFIKKYLTPDVVEQYRYLFFWDDDIDIGTFDCKNFLDIFERNNLQLAQPSLTPESYFTFQLTLKDPNQRVGRYTDFVEVMVPVMPSDYWKRYWEMIEENYNHWGMGYDSYVRSVCKLKNMGIIDQESVTHVKPVVGETPERRGGYERLKHKLNRYMLAKIVSYGSLR
jgi:hypothetical protein